MTGVDTDGIRDVFLDNNNVKWKFVYIDPENETAESNRTPLRMPGSVLSKKDSGIYIVYAIDCDYYDAPIFADSTFNDWCNIRRNYAFCMANAELIH